MIVVDTSALISILKNEPSSQACALVLAGEPDLIMSAGTLAELLILTERRQLSAEREALMQIFDVKIIAVDERLARLSLDAHSSFGKGVHPAGLNFGDCFAYALAKDLDCPLLFVGNDFSQTDIVSALASQHG